MRLDSLRSPCEEEEQACKTTDSTSCFNTKVVYEGFTFDTECMPQEYYIGEEESRILSSFLLEGSFLFHGDSCRKRTPLFKSPAGDKKTHAELKLRREINGKTRENIETRRSRTHEYFSRHEKERQKGNDQKKKRCRSATWTQTEKRDFLVRRRGHEKWPRTREGFFLLMVESLEVFKSSSLNDDQQDWGPGIQDSWSLVLFSLHSFFLPFDCVLNFFLLRVNQHKQWVNARLLMKDQDEKLDKTFLVYVEIEKRSREKKEKSSRSWKDTHCFPFWRDCVSLSFLSLSSAYTHPDVDLCHSTNVCLSCSNLSVTKLPDTPVIDSLLCVWREGEKEKDWSCKVYLKV